MTYALVIAGGDPPDRGILDGAGDAELVVAADCGLRVARTHGLSIDLVVGDLDSVSTGDVAWAEAEGAKILKVPSNKDFTDLELAIEQAAACELMHIVVVGIDGGRVDHELGNWAVLCAPRPQLLEIKTAGGTVTVLHGEFINKIDLSGEPGEIVSIISRNGDAEGVTTTGLRWPLDEAVLSSSSSLGVSNEFTGTEATVAVQHGTVMVARPTPACC